MAPSSLIETTVGSYRFSVPIQIRMSDLDPFVHVNNGAQCNYFDFGRSSYFEHVFQEPIDWLKMDMVLVHVELDFKCGIEFQDAIVCETKIISIGHKSVKMMQQLRDTRTNCVKTTCYSVLAGFDRLSHQSIPIREEYKVLFRAFENLPDDQQK
ncbi:MAG: acyl-CoA thioesterase [Bacteroidales bacterium]|nr:acyl-CoA thioesterase [Bacteroidales bacterium]